MILSDVRELIVSLGIAVEQNCYDGKLDNKKDKSIGSYHLKRDGRAHIPLGGRKNAKYDEYPASILVHWTKKSVESEQAAIQVYETLAAVRDVQLKNVKVNFIKMLVPQPVYVETDSKGVHEYVIEVLVFCERKCE